MSLLKMTILNINKYYFVKGGAERFYFDLAKLLEDKGHQVVPLAMEHEKNQSSQYSKYFVSEVQTDRVKLGWQGLRTVARYFWSFEAQRKLKKLIKKEQPEVAILHNIYHQISPSILPVLKKHKIPVMLIAHDYALLSPNYTMFVRGQVYDKVCGHGFLKHLPDKSVKDSWLASLVCGLELWWHNSILNVYKKNIDKVICPSKFMAKMFMKAGWPNNKIVHLPHFVESDPRARSYELRENYILYFGRLSVEKGIITLIEAMQNLPDIKLKIVGTGPEEAVIKNQLTINKINNVEMLGYQSGVELRDIVARAKFIVVPSEWYENYPLAVLESYVQGVPALVARIGGLPELALGEEFLFEPNNVKELAEKIRNLFGNEALLQKAGEQAEQFLQENNDPEKYYERLVKELRGMN